MCRSCALACSLSLTACAVGPAYHEPPAPTVARYTAAPRSDRIGAAPDAAGHAEAGQTLEPGATVDPHWWEQFASPALTHLVVVALDHNDQIAVAQATLDQAREQMNAVRGAFLPQIDAGLGAQRMRDSGAAAGGIAPQTYSLFTGQVSVSYDPDVFGLSRLLERDAQAQTDVARARLAAMRLAVAGNVVATTFRLAATDAQIAATRQSVNDQQQVLDLTRTQFRLGAIDQSSVLTQQSLLASTRSQLTQLDQAHDADLHLLATYLGQFPVQGADLAIPTLDDFTLPNQLPLSLPSTLVRARPDIRAAEAQLRAANAQVAVAVARMYPHLTLGADYGGQSNQTWRLFDPASRIWDLAAGLAAPLFEGGTLRAQKRAAEAAYRGVFANYRSTVLDAFREVADVLRALQHDADLLQTSSSAARDADAVLALTMTQYRTGDTDYLTVLTSETRQQAARIARIQAQAQRDADTAALYVALGGGDWQAATAAAPARPAQPVTKE